MEVGELTLANGGIALVDAEDLAGLLGTKWYRAQVREGVWYVRDARSRYLHRRVLQAKHGQIVDHINRDTFDNRKANLRVVSASANSHNSVFVRGRSGIRGVYRYAHDGRAYWCARLTVEGRTHTLGYFDEIEDARRARLLAENKYLGRRHMLGEDTEGEWK